jgi:predicted nucleic acid-binding protein
LGTFERLHLLQFDLTRADTVGIAEIRAATKLRMPDAVALHTAESKGAELVTTDRRLARAAEDRGVTAHLLAAAIPA